MSKFDLSLAPAGYKSNGKSRKKVLTPIESLSIFFMMRDRKFIPIIEDLFRIYEFHQIVKGIFIRFNCLPDGWRSELRQFKKKKDKNFKWLEIDKVKFVTTETETFPPPTSPLDILKQSSKKDKVENTILEMLISEYKFLQNLRITNNVYVVQIKAMADRKLGASSAENLGLEPDEVRLIFGTHLSGLVTALDQFFTKLETLVIVTTETSHSLGRVGQFADIIISSSTSLLKAYQNYSKNYHAGAQIFKKRGDEVGLQPPSDFYFRNLNFMKFWEEIIKSHPQMENPTLHNLLLQPVSRFTKYKLWMDTINKKLADQHPAKAKVEEACKRIHEVATEINDAVNANRAELTGQ